MKGQILLKGGRETMEAKSRGWSMSCSHTNGGFLLPPQSLLTCVYSAALDIASMQQERESGF